MVIRLEQPSDYAQIREMTVPAFAAAYGSGDVEADLIDALRVAPHHDPALALVAVQGDLVVGHVMLSPVSIESEDGRQWPALCLAPLGVRIEHQRQGIGSALMQAVLRQARERGHERVVLAGSEKYYPRFGFQDANLLGIRDELGTPSPHFMALALVEGALTDVLGIVRYPAAFDLVREDEA
jgi:putative acetyltransferase